MNNISFWSPLIISFIAFKSDDEFIAVLFLIIAFMALIYGVVSWKVNIRQVSRIIQSKHGSITIALDTQNATKEDVKLLNEAYAETMSMYTALITIRKRMLSKKK
jgi:intracellular septation protein A